MLAGRCSMPQSNDFDYAQKGRQLITRREAWPPREPMTCSCWLVSSFFCLRATVNHCIHRPNSHWFNTYYVLGPELALDIN